MRIDGANQVGYPRIYHFTMKIAQKVHKYGISAETTLGKNLLANNRKDAQLSFSDSKSGSMIV